MQSYASLQGPSFPLGIPYTQAFALFIPKLIDFAIILAKSNSLDNRGVLYLLGNTNFLAITGAAPNPRVHPGPIQGNRAQVATLSTLQQKFDV